MKKSEVIKKLQEIEEDMDVGILMQTTIDGEYFNLETDNIVSIDDDGTFITIRVHES